MAQKENIDILLLYIRKLDEAVTNMKGTEIYPASFFDQTMELTSRIMEELHLIETNQIEALQKQLEAHQALLQSVTRKERIAAPQITKEPQEEIQPSLHTAPEAPAPKPAVHTAETATFQPITTTLETEQKKEVLHSETVPDAKNDTQAQPGTPSATAEKMEPAHEPIKTIPQPSAVQTRPQTIQAPTEQRPGLFLNDLLEKKNLSDFKKAFSLNDRFRFRRELFNNNEQQMEQAINDLNGIQSYEESINYLNSVLKWDMENQAVKDFILLLEKRFL